MTGVSLIMAGALRRDLMARGVRHLDFKTCHALVTGMLRSIGTIERGTREDDAPRRCATNEVDLDGSCMTCGAAQGEICRREP
ncbi:hypothetical protein [Bradyrhizobium sp. 45]|uniref:hypothetical protein n=1 Tax=Bradyrhizobium sp. 45 TaxID=1043587 RepID=UPI001FF7D3AF|nr:hypothetical protein [Bradyrhizobium sp. 45]MCK1306307.1 hypothetical protein [Bradyrhizobium sp. 45]